MSMMVPSIFSASINRAAVLNNRDGSSIRDGASRRHGLDVSRHDLEDERAGHHSENGARSPRGLGRLFNFRRRHMELMEHRDVVFSSFDQSFLTSRLASGTPRLFHRTLRFFTSENQWVSVEGRVATPCASENGDDGEVSEYEPQEESGQNVLANREFGAPALEDGSPPLYSDDDESPPEYDVAAFLGSPLYRLHNGMLLDIHHAALQADDFIRYYGDCWNRCPQRL
ncbi:hypothetical protein E4U38_007124 [Claviceps purpurea]|nr:hypothetical protein E4U38_007124 [Claviceps purpurea]